MPPLCDQFAPWLLAGDPHAAHRLALLAEADKALAAAQPADASPGADVQPADAQRRQELADALERWRYQHLNEHAAAWPRSPAVQALADALDQTARQLAGRQLAGRQPSSPPLSPRNPRAAITDPAWAADAVGRALACLDPAVPLEEIEGRARLATQQHFGRPAGDGTLRRRVLLYAPLYLSSYCTNHCTYCGFRFPLDIHRRHLSVATALDQADLLVRRGFRHILLVAGDYPRLTTTDYFLNVLGSLGGGPVSPSLEIAPQTTAAYAAMAAAGACGLTLYQETYDPQLYAGYHPRGTKVSYDWRLEGAERAAEAGLGRVGLGVLLGLCQPERDLAALVRHGAYLRHRFAQLTLAFSLPRIHEAAPGFTVPHPVGDELFRRMYCGLRMAFPQAELVLSTREASELRNRLADVCITQMSAGSSTAPGGYAEEGPAADAGPPGPSPCGADDHCGQVERYDGQFPVHDARGPAEIHACLERAGLEPVWE